MPRSATTRYAILGMLTVRPMTGYKLREEISGSIGHFWAESFGQLYPMQRAVLDETAPDRPYWLVTIRYGIAVVEASLAWTAEAMASLGTDAPARAAMEASP